MFLKAMKSKIFFDTLANTEAIIFIEVRCFLAL